MPDLELTLYSGPHCRLCDHAEVRVQMANLPGVTMRKVDITSSLELKKAYGLLPRQLQEHGRRIQAQLAMQS